MSYFSPPKGAQDLDPEELQYWATRAAYNLEPAGVGGWHLRHPDGHVSSAYGVPHHVHAAVRAVGWMECLLVAFHAIDIKCEFGIYRASAKFRSGSLKGVTEFASDATLERALMRLMVKFAFGAATPGIRVVYPDSRPPLKRGPNTTTPGEPGGEEKYCDLT